MKIHKPRVGHVKGAATRMTRCNAASCDFARGKENRTVAVRNWLCLKRRKKKRPPIPLFQHKLEAISSNSGCFGCTFAVPWMGRSPSEVVEAQAGEWPGPRSSGPVFGGGTPNCAGGCVQRTWGFSTEGDCIRLGLRSFFLEEKVI